MIRNKAARTEMIVCLAMLLELCIMPVAVSAEDPNDTGIQIFQVGDWWLGLLPGKSGATWMGLFAVEDGFELRPTNMLVIEETVFADSEEQPIFIVSGEEYFTPGPVFTVFSGVLSLVAEQRVELVFGAKLEDNTYKNNSYSIKLKKVEEGPASEYLDCGSFIIELWHQGRSQELVVLEQICLPQVPQKILWAGDIDRDGGLDMVIILSRGWCFFDYTLFLSSIAEDGELMKEAASFTISCP